MLYSLLSVGVGEGLQLVFGGSRGAVAVAGKADGDEGDRHHDGGIGHQRVVAHMLKQEVYSKPSQACAVFLK